MATRRNAAAPALRLSRPSAVLAAMTRGATLYSENPAAVTRKTQKRKRRRKGGALSRQVAALRAVPGRPRGR